MSSLSSPLLLTVIAVIVPGPPMWCRNVVVESSRPPCWPVTVTLCVAFYVHSLMSRVIVALFE
jgi:hypothetical protein